MTPQTLTEPKTGGRFPRFSTLEENLAAVKNQLQEDTQELENLKTRRAGLLADQTSKPNKKTASEIAALTTRIESLTQTVEAVPATLKEIQSRIEKRESDKAASIKAASVQKQKESLKRVQQKSKDLSKAQCAAAECQKKLDKEWQVYGNLTQQSGTELPLLFVTVGSPLVISLSEIITPEVEKNVSHRSAETWQHALMLAGIR